MDFEAGVNRVELRRKDEADCMCWGHLKGSPAVLSFTIYLYDELWGFVLESLLKKSRWDPRVVPEGHPAGPQLISLLSITMNKVNVWDFPRTSGRGIDSSPGHRQSGLMPVCCWATIQCQKEILFLCWLLVPVLIVSVRGFNKTLDEGASSPSCDCS